MVSVNSHQPTVHNVHRFRDTSASTGVQNESGSHSELVEASTQVERNVFRRRCIYPIFFIGDHVGGNAVGCDYGID
jgi:hypothetical protein